MPSDHQPRAGLGFADVPSGYGSQHAIVATNSGSSADSSRPGVVKVDPAVHPDRQWWTSHAPRLTRRGERLDPFERADISTKLGQMPWSDPGFVVHIPGAIDFGSVDRMSTLTALWLTAVRDEIRWPRWGFVIGHKRLLRGSAGAIGVLTVVE